MTVHRPIAGVGAMPGFADRFAPEAVARALPMTRRAIFDTTLARRGRASGMAFMFESRHVPPTRVAMTTPMIQLEFDACRTSFRKAAPPDGDRAA